MIGGLLIVGAFTMLAWPCRYSSASAAERWFPGTQRASSSMWALMHACANPMISGEAIALDSLMLGVWDAGASGPPSSSR